MDHRHAAVSAPTRPSFDVTRAVLDRRRLLRWATGLSAAAAIPMIGSPASSVVAQSGRSAWKTWLLASPDALRPESPSAPSTAEIDELVEFAETRSDEMIATANHWGATQVTLPWDDLGVELTAATFPIGLFEVRALSHLRAAMNDALVAALDAQAAYERQAPAMADDRIVPLGNPSTAASTFPSEHAAVAGAASTVLAFVFPDASDDQFVGLAEEAALSRLWAGTNYRSDIEAGLELGRAIGQLAIEHAQADGSDAEWDGSGWPTGDGFYVPTPPNFVDPPFAPLGGTWATWVLPSGDTVRPAPFPAYGSVGWEAEVQTVRELTAQRTPEQERIIDYWLSHGPHGYYNKYARAMITRENVGDADAANLLTTLAVSIYDALVAIWDAKYHYWVARPITIDPELDLYIPTPPYPSYPGGFGAAAGAGATVLAHAFPEEESDLMQSAWEAAAQRGWCGIHYVLDDDVALLMGSQVGRMVADAAHPAGSS